MRRAWVGLWPSQREWVKEVGVLGEVKESELRPGGRDAWLALVARAGDSGVTRDQLSRTCTNQPSHLPRPFGSWEIWLNCLEPTAGLLWVPMDCFPSCSLGRCLCSTSALKRKPTSLLAAKRDPLMASIAHSSVAFAAVFGNAIGKDVLHITYLLGLLVPPTSFSSFSLFDGTKPLSPLSSARCSGPLGPQLLAQMAHRGILRETTLPS